MSSYNVKTHPAFSGYNLPDADRFDNGIRRFFKGLAMWSATNRAYQNTVAELSVLSDRDLEDIGIARCDIPQIARDAAEEVRRGH